MMIKYQMCVLTTFKNEIYKRLNAFQSGPLRSKEAVNLYSPLSDLGFHSIPWRCENSEVGRSTSRPQSRTKQTVMMSRQLQGLSGGRQLWCFLQSVSNRLPLVAIWLYAYLKKTMLLGAYVVLQFRQQLRQYLWKMSEFVSDLWGSSWTLNVRKIRWAWI